MFNFDNRTFVTARVLPNRKTGVKTAVSAQDVENAKNRAAREVYGSLGGTVLTEREQEILDIRRAAGLVH